MIPLADRGGPAVAPDPVQGAGGPAPSVLVEELMELLRLTAVEAQPVLVDDDDDADLVDPECALVGKVLSPSVLHTNTISAVMRPA